MVCLYHIRPCSLTNASPEAQLSDLQTFDAQVESSPKRKTQLSCASTRHCRFLAYGVHGVLPHRVAALIAVCASKQAQMTNCSSNQSANQIRFSLQIHSMTCDPEHDANTLHQCLEYKSSSSTGTHSIRDTESPVWTESQNEYLIIRLVIKIIIIFVTLFSLSRIHLCQIRDLFHQAPSKHAQ